jgi:RsmE family RNA methyltransferase
MILSGICKFFYNIPMNICLFTQEEINQPLNLKDERAQHLIKVLHKKEGDTFTAGIVDGQSGTAAISKINLEEKYISFTFQPQGDGKPLYPLTMIIGFPRPIQLKRLLRDMAGLGVDEIHLTATQLTDKSYLKSDLASPENCRQMLFDGTVQAGGTHIPQIFMHTSLEECLSALKDKISSTPDLYALDNIDASDSLNHRLLSTPQPKSALAAIGSERGWTAAERKLFEEKGFCRLRMGERIFRTETASTVAASLILARMGKLE